MYYQVSQKEVYIVDEVLVNIQIIFFNRIEEKINFDFGILNIKIVQ